METVDPHLILDLEFSNRSHGPLRHCQTGTGGVALERASVRRAAAVKIKRITEHIHTLILDTRCLSTDRASGGNPARELCKQFMHS